MRDELSQEKVFSWLFLGLINFPAQQMPKATIHLEDKKWIMLGKALQGVQLTCWIVDFFYFYLMYLTISFHCAASSHLFLRKKA